MTHRSFTQDPVQEPEEPTTFDFLGLEDLQCRPEVNGNLLIALIGKADSESIKDQADGITGVLDVAVETEDGENPEDWFGKKAEKMTRAELVRAGEMQVRPGLDPTSSLGKLYELIDDPKVNVSIDLLTDLVGWLVEVYTNRPTQSAGTSGAGTRNTKPTSRPERRASAKASAKSKRNDASTSSTA